VTRAANQARADRLRDRVTGAWNKAYDAVVEAGQNPDTHTKLERINDLRSAVDQRLNVVAPDWEAAESAAGSAEALCEEIVQEMEG
jgi:hypothetical protein